VTPRQGRRGDRAGLDVRAENSNTARRTAARELAAHQKINYCVALRRLNALQAMAFADEEFVIGPPC
jgi:hypothetical protein